MITRSKLFFVAASLTFSFQLNAHTPTDDGLLYMEANRRPKERHLLRVPDIEGYQTLKCDLHMHTVFSDGLVWPTIRVQEAWEEGLDAISITDHLEYQPHKDDIPTNHNRAYELSIDAARAANILLLKGSELTRDTPPGHFNAVFLQDSETVYVEKEPGNLALDRKAIDKAAEQKAFIFWNHPGWKTNSIKGSYEWIPFVDEVYQSGKLDGIEVINGFYFHRKALDWAIEKGLTVMGSSDVHNLIAHDYTMEKGVHRSMTLVFAKERSLQGIREALDSGRTVAWSSRLMAGREEWIRALYMASVKVMPPHTTDQWGYRHVEIVNNSDLTFSLERLDASLNGWPKSFTLNPGTSQILQVKEGSEQEAAHYQVTNAFIGGNQNLVVEISL